MDVLFRILRRPLRPLNTTCSLISAVERAETIRDVDDALAAQSFPLRQKSDVLAGELGALGLRKIRLQCGRTLLRSAARRRPPARIRKRRPGARRLATRLEEWVKGSAAGIFGRWKIGRFAGLATSAGSAVTHRRTKFASSPGIRHTACTDPYGIG